MVTDAVLAWAVQNSDPANLVMLLVIYAKLRQEHRQVRSTLEDLKDEHPEV